MEEFFAGIILASIVCVLIAKAFLVPQGNITEGREFIVDNASYKCVKTNELLGEKK